MKKSFLFLLAILLIGSAFAQQAPTTKLLSSSESRLVVQVDLNGFSTAKVMTPQGEQYIVNVPKMAAMLEAGTPDLPTLPIPAIIGDRAEMTVNVIDAQYTDIANMPIAPSKGNISRQINPDDVPYTYGEMYQQNAFWPATQAYLEAPYILRDFRGQNIMVRPFAYNPATQTLRVYESLTIEMTKVSDNGANQKISRRDNTVKISPESKATYSRRFINYDAATSRYSFVEDAGEMLVICADQFMAGMQPLVDWKNQSGRPTTMVSLSEAGGNNATAIKSYITNLYNDPEHNLAYVLFVGDYEHITPHPFTAGYSTEYSDNWFGQIEGNDHYEEVLIGRFSVQTDAHVATQVNKVLFYERDMTASENWVNRGLGIGYIGAGTGHYNEDDYQHIDFIRDTLLHYTYTNVTDLHGGYGGSASVNTISSAVNQGVSIINYCNHGSEYSWGVADYSTSNVNALVNDNKLPIVWSVACLNGKFNYSPECFAESWLRATNNSTGTPTGAVGGMFSWMSQPWVPPMYGQDEMVDILTEWRHADQFNHTLGGASLNGNFNVIDMTGSSGYDTHDTWILFGDPSLMVRTDNPADMGVTANPSTLMVGMNELTVTATADYGIATLSLNDEVLASGQLINGQCTLSFPALNNVGEAQLVVMGYNKATYVGAFNVIAAEGAFITLDSYELSAPQANNGDLIDMSINLKNVGVETANNLTATISTECEYVEITSAEASFSEIQPDQILTLEGFQFAVSEDVPDQTLAEFILIVTDGENTWENNIRLMLHAPILDLVTVEHYQELDLNYLSLTFKNAGSAPFYGGTLNVYSSSANLVFDSTTLVTHEVVEGDGTLTLLTTYTVAPATEIGSVFEVAYEMATGLLNYAGTYYITYGAITEDFESGAFGENWTFSEQYPWRIVTGGTKGEYCAKSSNNGINNSEGYMQLTVDVLAPGTMTFDYKVSSESNYDKLHFYMDGQEKGTWSGSVSWATFEQPVAVGTHTFKWSYTKDQSVNSNDDCAWVDNIVFPPTNVVTFIDPVTDLEATVDTINFNVTLTWTPSEGAANYIVMRDDEEIQIVTDPTFTETLEQGVYEYAIIAQSAEGLISIPVKITVSIIGYNVASENDLYVKVYPNPTNDVLYIKDVQAQYRYSMYNGMGQQVASGTAQGAQQIDVKGLAKGVYFLRIETNTQTIVQKIVVK